MKKITSALLAMAMMISLSCFGASAETSDQEEVITLDNYQDKIVEAVKETENITSDNIEIISLDNSSSRSANPEMAIRVYSEDGATTIIPQIIVEDELVNSFTYVKSALMTRSQSFNTTHLSDLTISFFAGYDKKLMSNALLAFRPTAFSWSWSSSKSNVSVTKLSASFKSYGQYWDTQKATYLGKNISSNYTSTRNNPTKGTKYYGTVDTGIISGRGIVCTVYPDHGGIVSYNISYKVNGSSKSDSHNFTLFDKGGDHSPY